jgi:uncharacterized membrane protein
METSNEIVIHAPAERVFAYAADTERWPAILPHYRWVRRIKGTDDHKIVGMAAWRDIYPVRWTAVQRNLPGDRRITFKHVRGISRGMNVEWRVTPTPDGAHVRIWHEFHSRIPLVGGLFADLIVGRLFVSNIAGKTLRRIKQLAEEDEAAGGASSDPAQAGSPAR